MSIQFSLRWLFGLILLAAVGCGLLRFATPMFAKLLFTVVLMALTASLVRALCEPSDGRAFWTGFTVFGFAYVWAICGTWQSPDGSAPLRNQMVTSPLLDWCYDRLPIDVSPEAAASVPEPFTAAW